MQSDSPLGAKPRIEVNLRLWSDHVPIAAILEGSSFEVEHCHSFGEPIAIHGRVTNRIARRHYASLQSFKTKRVGEISKWFIDTQKKLDANYEISRELRSGQIEGVIWLAIFGDKVQPLPAVDATIIAKFTQQCVNILVENYTDLDADGLPRKTWLTSSQR